MPRNKYPEETVQKILDASLKLFMEKGFEQTTILDIVDNLGGLTRGAFYHHFKSKEDVLIAIQEKLLDDTALFEDLLHDKELTGLEKIQKLIDTSMSRVTEDKTRTALNQATLTLMSNPRFLAEHLKDNQKTAIWLMPIMEQGMADGSIPPGNPKLLAELFMLVFNFWCFPTIFPCDEKEFMEKLEFALQVFASLGIELLSEEAAEKAGATMFELLQVQPDSDTPLP
ncbi:MAG: TetR/AcrR family transcriptional regulator [Oscillospiraceae bacterium]|nr:TetR/AcrR family transcriptional regulator [Oscillospiraceae bacterium]